MAKGSSFERKVCKLLSKWWSGGKRDDIFWRSSISGGRATIRAKRGQRTYGSYGDIAAVDPIGEPLLRWVTIELKCGRSHGCPMDLLDGSPRKFEATLTQAYEAHKAAGSQGWMLVCKPDRRAIMAYLDLRALQAEQFRDISWGAGTARFSHRTSEGIALRFAAMPLETFFSRLPPSSFLS